VALSAASLLFLSPFARSTDVSPVNLGMIKIGEIMPTILLFGLTFLGQSFSNTTMLAVMTGETWRKRPFEKFGRPCRLMMNRS